MSELMLLAVLRMPPELWTGEAIDVIQRHARYIDAADRIEAQQSKIATLTEQVRAQDKWISVDEGFPLGFHQECLVWRSGDNKNFHAAVDYLIDEETFSEHYYVTHWMPLPTPPKEAE